MPTVKYVGPARPAIELIVDQATGESATVEYTHEIEVSAAVRDSLLAQSRDYEAAHGSALWSEVKRESAKDSKKEE